MDDKGRTERLLSSNKKEKAKVFVPISLIKTFYSLYEFKQIVVVEVCRFSVCMVYTGKKSKPLSLWISLC